VPLRPGLDTLEKRNLFCLLGFKPQFLIPPDHGLVTLLTRLSLLMCLVLNTSSMDVKYILYSRNIP